MHNIVSSKLKNNNCCDKNITAVIIIAKLCDLLYNIGLYIILVCTLIFNVTHLICYT